MAQKASPGALAAYRIERSFRDTLFGKVRRGTHIQTNSPVVIKEYSKILVSKRITRQGMPVAEDAMKEIQVHLFLSHQRDFSPYVVRLLDVQQDVEKIYTVLEFCGNGDFFSFVQQGKYDIRSVQHYSKQMMAGVYYLHTKNVCHLDLSLENLLMDDKLRCKICDFGVAIQCAPNTRLTVADKAHRPGKIRYMCPEIFACRDFNPRAADIWSCGVIIFIMLVQVFPFDIPCDSDDRFHYIITGNLSKLLASWNKTMPAQAVDLLQRMLMPEQHRITMEQIVKHPWLN